MQKYNGALLRKFDDPVQGNASVGTSVVVRKKSDNSIAPIYSVDDVNSIQKPNPFTTDAFGRYSFFAPNGKYIIQFGDGSDEIEISMVDNLDLSLYRKSATVQEVESGNFVVGERLSLTDRVDAPFNIEPVGEYTINGFDILYAGSGRVAVLVSEIFMHADSFGLSTSRSTNDSAMIALINRLKTGTVKKISFSSGIYKFKCFDTLTRGRASFETRDIENVEFVGGVSTVFKAVTGGFGTDPFAICRVDKNTKNVKFLGIEFDGDYSNVPEFQGQLANRSGGIIIASWDFASPSQESYEDLSIDGVEIIGCKFTNVGGGITTQRKSANTPKGAYTSITVHNCRFENAQQSNNTISADYAYYWTVTKNIMKTTIPLSDTIWTLGVDMSRGGIGNEVAHNVIEKYHSGIKAEYFLYGGLSGTDIELSIGVNIHDNRLIDIGHPTIDVISGPSGSGSYGIRMSGTNIVERDNYITGLFNSANVGKERRLVFGVWANQSSVQGTRQNSVGGEISACQNAVVHDSSDASNTYTCERKKIRDVNQGIVLQAGGMADDNDIRRVKGVGIAMQICDQTFARRNYIAETMQGGGLGAAIYGQQSGSDAAYRYWEVIDNEIITVNSGEGTGVIINGGSNYAKEYRYKSGRMIDVAARENFELVSDILEDTPVKAKGVLNPATGVLIKTINVASATQVDSNTVEITFLKPMPNNAYVIDAREPNNAAVQWINFGTTTTTLRLRSVNTSNAPVPLPSSLMFAIY